MSFIKVSIINYLFRIIGMILGFISIPITLNYLGDERFGIWQTILTIISWATLANFGIGNGLRNKITELVAKNKLEKVQANVSAAYILILKISLVILFVLLLCLLFLNPKDIFLGTSVNNSEIRIAFLIVIFNFCLNFVIGLCNSVAYGLHKSHYTTIQQTVTSLITLIMVYILNSIVVANIVYIAIVYSLVTTFGNITLSILMFSINKDIIPKIKYKKSDVEKDMYGLGFKFFFLQLGSLLLISTDNFLISKYIGAQDVTYYSILNKLFVTINTLYSILLIPLWNSSAEAYQRKEFQWILSAIKKLLLSLIPVALILVFCVILFDQITYLWIGRTSVVENNLIILMAIYVFLLCFNGIFINIQNGIGKVKIQMFSVFFAVIVNIPCAIYFIQYLDLSVSGVILANIISQIIILVFCPLDVVRFLQKKQKED
ncbi:lipopolysaccharide biosynthesis protein [Bacillus sp. E214]|uniref:lipopolysaccharide biosynthesis protein n=1 Tax=Bacillus sp. E214 TaxID=2587156 RepID=UPI0016524F27|nr:oligosaccharide flippase family protein [Bacillus sp. E214]